MLYIGRIFTAICSVDANNTYVPSVFIPQNAQHTEQIKAVPLANTSN